MASPRASPARLQHNKGATVYAQGIANISTTPFYVVKLSACSGEGFYIHALIL